LKIELDVIVKEQLVEYLKNNEKILELYDLNPSDLKQELLNFRTTNPTKITFKEFVSFLKVPRSKYQKTESYYNEEPAQKFQEITMNQCLLQKKEIVLLEKIYNDLDRHQDYIVPLKELVIRIKNDVHIARILQEPAIYLPKIKKAINFERVLNQMEQEGVLETEKREKEFISLKYFLGFLTKYQWKPYTTREFGNENAYDEDLIVIEKNLLQMMKGF